MTCDARTGDKIRFEPRKRGWSIVEGLVVDVLNEGEGLNVLAPADDDPTRVLRVWKRDGSITVLERAVPIPASAAPPRDVTKKADWLPYKAPGDLADEYRQRGLDRQAAWREFIKDTILLRSCRSESLDAKEFFQLFDKGI